MCGFNSHWALWLRGQRSEVRSQQRTELSSADLCPLISDLCESPPCCNGSLPSWYGGSVGSIPTGGSSEFGIRNADRGVKYALVEQPGVLATLSRWRSRVQIPSGAL